jgi:TetR/AcrR family transcriptional regulator, mexJK operon transcriptional repressor
MRSDKFLKAAIVKDEQTTNETVATRKWRADDPRRLRMSEKRVAILRAAGPILLRDGLGGTTLDRVAAEGKIAKMTLYRHFASKEALFEGLVTAMCEQMRESIENAPSAGIKLSSRSQLKAELRAFTAEVVKPDALALYRLVVADGWRFPDLSRAFEQSGMHVIRRRIAKLLQAGGVSASRLEQLAAEVVALALGDAYQRALLGIAHDGDDQVFSKQIDAAVSYALTAK